jgi:rubredoxin
MKVKWVMQGLDGSISCLAAQTYTPSSAVSSPALAGPGASRFNRATFAETATPSAMKAYMCVICGYVYEEEKGDPVSGIAPGTRWDDVPLSWRCPDCGAGKEDFEMIEV